MPGTHLGSKKKGKKAPKAKPAMAPAARAPAPLKPQFKKVGY